MGSPGWGLFHGSKALPDDRLGIAQLSNRLLIPPDALPFEGNPAGELLGFQQYPWSDERKAKLQALVEKIHAH